MKTTIKIIFCLAICIGMLPNTANSCTTFVLKGKNGEMVFGRNLDFPSGLGHIHINKRNLHKTSFTFPPEKPFTWVSKYGSISFNQNGKELPYGGINEAGLVVEQMWHQDAKYPEIDDRHGLSELQWIQYHLDNSASVEEVVKSDSFLRVSVNSVATLHFLIADVGGNMAVIEYIEGKMLVHKGKDLIYPVLANCSYEVSLDYKKEKETNSNKPFTAWTENSSGRFTKAANLINQFEASGFDINSYAFKILQQVSQGPSTQWSIVYDLKNRIIHYRTQQQRNIKSLRFNDFDYSCESANFFIDIDMPDNKPDDFEPYSFEANFKIIDRVCNSVEFLKQMPHEYRLETARYPEQIICIKE